jgi:hypothetical protein
MQIVRKLALFFQISPNLGKLGNFPNFSPISRPFL